MCFFLLASLNSTIAVQAQTKTQAQTNRQVQINAQIETYHSFLRINKLYVLFTDPIVPHADRNGIFWVGLRPMALLMGAQVSEGTAQKSVTVGFGSHTLVFTSGAATATLDGKRITLSAAAKQVGPEHQMVVPLAALTQAFHLKAQWNKQRQVFTLSDSGLIQKGAAGEFAGLITQFEGPPRAYRTQVRAFTGPPFPISPIVPIAPTQKGAHLNWTLKNVSGRDYPQVDINALVEGKAPEDRGQEGFLFSTSYPNPIKTYPIYSHKNLDYGLISVGTHSSQPLDYIVIWIVP
jgi:hypothetical protein